MNFHGRHEIRVRVLPAIPYESFSDRSVEETAEMVRSVIIEEHGALKHETSETAGG
jgi:hypothetical protein